MAKADLTLARRAGAHAAHASRNANRATRNRITAACRLLHPDQAGLDDAEILERLAVDLERQLVELRTAPADKGAA